MRKKGILLFLCFSIFISGCGKKEDDLNQKNSYQKAGCIYIEDGLLYHGEDRVEYYEYETGTYMPLCAEANCLHNTNECMAVYLNGATVLGKVGEQWYYLMNDGWNYNFYSADLNGQNEKKIGTITHSVEDPYLFYEDSCIYSSTDFVYDEETNDMKYYISTIYRYCFDEKREEVLVPGIINVGYDLYGEYKDQLLYIEKTLENGYVVKSLNLKTGETKSFLENVKEFRAGDLNGRFFVYMARINENTDYKIMELDLETGNEKEIWTYTGEDFPLFSWESEMKIFSFINSTENYRKTYLYTEDGNCELIREEEYKPYYNIFDIENGQIIVQFLLEKSSKLGKMGVNDFVAGKDDWVFLED